MPAAGLRRAAWRPPPRPGIYGLAGRALLRLHPPGLMARRRGQHAKDAAAVPEAVVGAETGCSRRKRRRSRRRRTTTCR
jgi:hypothetical protein